MTIKKNYVFGFGLISAFGPEAGNINEAINKLTKLIFFNDHL